MKYWAIACSNLKGEDDVFYFRNYEIAKKNFEILCEKNKTQTDFFERPDENTASWFDASYNEYSTCIRLMKGVLPTIHNEIIF